MAIQIITFMFLCTHRHSNLIIFLAVQQTQALLIHDQLPVGWGGVGRVITFMFLCTHRHGNLIIFLAVLQTQALLFHDTQDAREIAIPHNKHAFPPDAHTHKHITNIYAAGIKPFAER